MGRYLLQACIRCWLPALSIVLLFGSSAEAQWNTSIHWGFMRAKAIHLEPTLTELTSGSTWLYGDWDIGYVANDKVSIHVGVGGFAAESTVLTSITGVPVTLKIEPTVVTFPLFARVALNEPGQTVRAFLEGGPSISSVEADVSAAAGGFSQGLGVSDERVGYSAGIGFIARLGQGSLKLIPRVRYNFISKANGAEFDGSNVTVTIGIGFGRM